MRRNFLLAALVVAVLWTLSVFTPWWFYPGTWRWGLHFEPPPGTRCMLVGEAIPLGAVRLAGDPLWYSSDDAVARALGRFRWRVLAPTDSFWLARRDDGPSMSWRGTADIDRNGVLTGKSEGFVAVELREGRGVQTQLYLVMSRDSLTPGSPAMDTTIERPDRWRPRLRLSRSPCQRALNPKR